jgi:hypothetical protein
METTHSNQNTTGAHGVNRNHFDIKSTLKAGWEKFKEQWSNLLMALFAYIVAVAPLNLVDFAWSTRLYEDSYEWNEFLQESVPTQVWVAGTSETILYVIFAVVMFVWSIIVGYNWYRSYFSVYDGHVYKFADMFVLPNKETINHIANYIIGYILYILAILAGLVLLIIPGMYVAIRFQFVPNLLVDKKMKFKEAFALSTKMTENIKWKLFGFGLLQGIMCLGVVLVGFIALIVGVIPAAFVAFGWMMFANVGLYRKLYAINA